MDLMGSLLLFSETVLPCLYLALSNSFNSAYLHLPFLHAGNSFYLIILFSSNLGSSYNTQKDRIWTAGHQLNSPALCCQKLARGVKQTVPKSHTNNPTVCLEDICKKTCYLAPEELVTQYKMCSTFFSMLLCCFTLRSC